MNLAQIRSAVPAIHCRMRVPRIKRVSTISRIWCINSRQTINVNSEVSGPKFTKCLHDVKGLLLSYLVIRCGMRVSRRKACRRFRPISRLKLVAMETSLDRSGNQYQIEHLTNMSTIPENLVKIGLAVFEISLLQAIVKEEEEEE